MGMCKKVFFWWWAWKSEAFEQYLEDMHLAGWATQGTSMGHTVIHLTQDSPQHVRYCVDYQSQLSDEYRTIMDDDGWHLLAISMGWVIWSKPYQGDRPNLYTDKLSLIDRNNRILKLLGIVALLQFPMLNNLMSMVADRKLSLLSPFVWIYGLVLSLLVFGVVQLLRYNKRLRSSNP